MGKTVEVSIHLTALDGTRRVFDGVGESLRRLKAEFGGDDSLFSGSVKDAKQMVDLQSAIDRQEKAALQTKSARISLQTKELQAEKALEQAIAAENTAKKKSIELEREQLRLAEARKKASESAKSSSNSTPNRTNDPLKASALLDIKRIEEERARWNKVVSAEITRSDKAFYNTKKVAAKQSADDIIRELERVKKASAESTNNSSGLGGFGAVFGGSLAAAAVSEITSLAKQGGTAVLNYSANLEQVAIGFERLEGSSSKAQSQIRALQDFANKTPLTFEGLLPTAQRFEEIGFKGENLIPVLRDIGNVVAGGVGKPGEGLDARLERVGLALKQTFDKNRVQMEELNQLSEAGVNGLEILARATGKPKAELVKLVEQGQITGNLLLESLQKVSRSDFGTSMERQSRTFNGALSTIEDTLLVSASRAFEPYFKKAADFAVDLSKELEGQDFGGVKNTLTQKLGQAISLSIKEVSKDASSGFGSQLKKDLSDLFSGQFDFGKSLERDLPGAAGILEGLFGANPVDIVKSAYELGFSGKTDLKQFTDADIKKVELVNFFGLVNDQLAVLKEQAKQRKEALYKELTVNPNLLGSGAGVVIGALLKKPTASKTEDENLKNLQAKEDADLRRRLADANRRLQLSFAENQFSVQSASIASRVDLTEADRRGTFEAQSKNQKDYLNRQITLQTQAFNEEIKLNKDNKLEVAKIQIEKTEALTKLNSQLLINEINTQKQITELERDSAEKRRKAAIEFKQLQITQTSFGFDSQTFDAERLLSQSAAGFENLYERLKQIAVESNTEIRQLTNEQFKLQLQDQTLTAEQRENIVRQMYFEQRKLAEDNRRALIAIEERQYKESITRLETAFSRRQDILQSFADQTAFGSSLLSKDVFSANSSDLIQRALTGNTLAGLKDETQTAVGRQTLGIEQDLKTARAALQTAISNNDVETVKQFGLEIETLSDSLRNSKAQFDDWGSLVDENVLRVNLLVEKIKSSSGAVSDFDALGLAALKLRQKQQSDLIDAEIHSYGVRAKAASDARNYVDLETFTYAKLAAERKKANNEAQKEAETNAYLAQTTQGLIEQINKLRAGNNDATRGVRDEAQKQILSGQKALLEENIALQERIAAVGSDAADRYENAWLNATLEVRDANIQAVEQQIAAQVRLADGATLHVEQVRAQVLNHLADVTNKTNAVADGIISAFDKAVNYLDKRLGKLGDIPILGDLARFGNQQFLSKITTGLLDTFLPPELSAQFKKTGNPTVDAINKSNDYLKDIRDALKTPLVSSGSFSGIGGQKSPFGNSPLGSLLGGLFGGGNQGPGGTPLFTPFGGGGFNAFAPNGNSNGLSGGFDFGGFAPFLSSGSGSVLTHEGIHSGAGTTTKIPLLDQLKGIVSGKPGTLLGKGGIFGKDGFGANVGTFQAIGSLAQMVGGLFGSGSRLGRTITYAGTGLSIGAQIGSFIPIPGGTLIGAAAGATIGALIGLFTNPQRKKEEALRSEYRDKAVAALTQLTAAAQKGDASAKPQGDTVISEYRSAVSQFKDKKTRNIALNELNPPNIIWQKYEELKKAAVTGAVNSDRSSRILPEFAAGGYMSDAFGAQFGEFKRRYGILKGGIPGKDSIPTLAMEGEMFLTKNHQDKIRRRAGYDIFQDIDLPNYPRSASRTSPQRFAEGGVVGSASVPFFAGGAAGLNVNVSLHNVIVNEDSYLEIEKDGVKEFVNLFKEAVRQTLLRRQDFPTK